MSLHWSDENRREYERLRDLMGRDAESPHITNLLNAVGEGLMSTEQALVYTVRHLAISNAGLMKDMTALAMARPFQGVIFKPNKWASASKDTMGRCVELLKALRLNGNLTGNRQEVDRLIGNCAMLRDGEIPGGLRGEE